MKKGVLNLWNLHEYVSDEAGYRLCSRSNCGLERYNFHFNNIFSRRHPGLVAFTTGLNKETDEQVTRLKNVMDNKDIPPTYDDIDFPVIPDEYGTFETPEVFISLTGKVLKKKSTVAGTSVRSRRSRKQKEVYDV